jgi:hypothetical protein
LYVLEFPVNNGFGHWSLSFISSRRTELPNRTCF